MTSTEEEKITILACGDIMLADFYFNIGMGLGSLIKEKGSNQIFENIRPLLQTGDLLVGNLECPISDSSTCNGLHKREFLASPTVIRTLFDEGFRILNIANNHISQHGFNAFKDTIRNLEDNGIAVVGEIHSGNNKQHLIIKTIKGKKLGFLSYSLVDDHFEQSPWYYAYRPNKKDILDQIGKAKKECDFLTIMLHWGEEFINFPSQSQVELAHDLIDGGCDLIIGSHSHVFQGVEQYHGKVIAYSLGNFVFSMPWKLTRVTGILKIQLNSKGLTYSVIPIWIDQNFNPIIPHKKHKEYVDKTLKDAHNKLASINTTQYEYSKIVKEGLVQYRISTWISFIQNLINMPIKVSFQLLFEFFGRRIFNHKI